jgi:hypothetical protein
MSGGQMSMLGSAYAATGQITAGVFGSATGFIFTGTGSLSPSGLQIAGAPINRIADDSTGPWFALILGATLEQSAFAVFTINGVTYRSADATFLVGGGLSQWRWTPLAGLSSGQTYPFSCS